ncbi:energy-coupling factor transporter transmembrane protein EcfT [Romeria aff. gracilis LEGE 07310]|uniref:Energy-coupling factor transporter transmembrane protein EcfT n=1 Tax=Vasconcelosia minhoensis LEGE 07310 TaxID=915328 RepID=A0A8J7APH2_9CYAN|nr:energy-coupling factor transporter transmembrane protein EcfT [Romeria gracilis]MBE9078159.1 energy-coupling factor transporter transmembrane protein EcfT [Romeria aff. gracilis LEGE 07310]
MDLLRSLPLGLYLEQPVTWLHRVDIRVKLAWLLSILLAPILANPTWRLAIVVLLILLTLTARIPLRVWRQQMGWLLVLCLLIAGLIMVMPDGIAVTQQPRLPGLEQLSGLDNPPEDLTGLDRPPEDRSLPQPTGYRYVLLELGWLKVTQQSMQLAIKTGTLLFTLIYGTNLFLLTSAPEEITAGLEDLMQPLRWLNIPVTEIALTLTLALRFIPLVLEEVQNLVRSVRTRAINWQKLGLRRAAGIWLMLSERLLENLLLRADQIASAMRVREFTSPNRHRVQWHQLRLHWWDWAVLLGLALFWWGRLAWGGAV